MKKLYLYIRLSDADDDLKFKTESESIANQRTLLYRFIRILRLWCGKSLTLHWKEKRRQRLPLF